jgi:hypothetical protein
MNLPTVKSEQSLDEKAIEFNDRRTTALLELTLEDLLFFNPILFAIHDGGIAGELTSYMLRNKLFDIEKQLLDDLFSDYQQNPNIIIQKIIQWDNNFRMELACAENRFVAEFINRFCDSRGYIDWAKLVEFNSGNYDLTNFSPETF